MKIFHISDLHIGLKLLSRDLKEDQQYILSQIAESIKKEKPDALLVAGDIYDRPDPSAEAIDMFDDFINGVRKASPDTVIMIVSGNHDSTSRLNLYRNILNRENLYMIGNPPATEDQYMEKVTLTDEYGIVNFYLLPFVKPSMVKEITGTKEDGRNMSFDEALHSLIERENIDQNERNVFVSHQFYIPAGINPESVQRMDSETVSVGNVDAVCGDFLTLFDYSALGHIHKPMQVGNEFARYCGTPLACSVSEAGQNKGIISVTLEEKGKVKTEVIPLIPLRQVRKIECSLSEVKTQYSEDFVSLVLTDDKSLNTYDMQSVARASFPNLLEISRKNIRKADYSVSMEKAKEKTPFELCCDFLGDLTDDERDLVAQIVNLAEEEK